MQPLNVFIPIYKVDEEQRLVYGRVADETSDNSGECFDYEGSKPFFQKWSDNAFETSGGKSKGNVRTMHGKVAAGKLTDLAFDDKERTIDAVAKVVDDNEWKKVEEGVYTGFSMGGRYVKRWTEKVDGEDRKRYIADPVEVSLVDKPCIKTATFTLIKSDGAEEERHFTSVIESDHLEKGYNPDQPRDTDGSDGAAGQWISGGGSGGGSGGVDGAMPTGYEGKDTNEAKYNHEQVRQYQANAKTAREYAEAETKEKGLSDKEKQKVYQDKLDELDGDRLKAFSAGLREAKAKDKEIKSKAKKSDDGEQEMSIKSDYVPTNDELMPKAQELAKADGKDGTQWLDYIEQARTALIAEKSDGGEDKGDFKDEKKPSTAPDKEGEEVTPPAKDGEKEGAKEEGEEKDDKEGKKAPPFGGKGAEKSDDGEKEEEAKADAASGDGEEAKKADEIDYDATPPQLWHAVDGTTFARKADAVSHNQELKKAASGEPSLLSVLGDLSKSVEAVKNGEDADAEKDDTPELAVQCNKMAEFLSDPEVVEKSMYTVERTARMLREVGSLAIAVAKEERREGDTASKIPAALKTSVDGLGQILIDMATEEVGELIASVSEKTDEVGLDHGGYVYPEMYIELASSSLGLEKSDAEDFFGKAIEASGRTKARVQKMHDHTTGLGAKCSKANCMEEVDAKDDMATKLAKFDGLESENANLKKQIEAAMPMIEKLKSDIEDIKKRPLPGGPARTHVVSKGDDVSDMSTSHPMTIAAMAEKFDADDLAEVAIRMAQKRGLPATGRG